MTNVVDLAKAREAKQPHMTGSAVCLNCGHKWRAVAPIGTVHMECPECHLNHGRFMELVEDDAPHFTCHCQNQFFHITPKRIYCVICGDTVEPF